MEGLAEGGEEGSPPRFGPGGGTGDRGVRDIKGFDSVGVSLEPFLKDGHRAGGGGRGGDEGGKSREDTLPVSFDPVRGGVRGAELRGTEGDHHRDMVRTCGWERGIPSVEGGRQ